jgi:sporulation related protein
MAKKPAPLTSDLLVRKGEATPSSIESTENETAPVAPEEVSAPAQAAAPIAEDGRPQTPEPEIVLAADEVSDDDHGSRRRLAGLLALVAVVTAGVFAFSMYGSDNGTPSVAPVSSEPDVAASDEQSVAPIISTPGPASDGAPTPPAQPELRLETEDDVATIAPITENAAPDLPVVEDPVSVEEAPITQPREAATITPQIPAAPEATVTEAAAPTAAIQPAGNIAKPGQYLVQLLSVRSESAARTAWTQLQAAHEGLLGDQTLNLETADLGERGTYHRVRFGAYDARSEANSVCKSLKDAGQDCLVKRAD